MIATFEVHLIQANKPKTKSFRFIDCKQVKSKVKGMLCFHITLDLRIHTFIPFTSISEPYLIRGKSKGHENVLVMSPNIRGKHLTKQPYKLLRKQYQEYCQKRLLDSL